MCVCVCVCVCVRADAQPTCVERRACVRARERAGVCAGECLRHERFEFGQELGACLHGVRGGGAEGRIYPALHDQLSAFSVASRPFPLAQSAPARQARALSAASWSSTLCTLCPRASMPRCPCCCGPAHTHARLCVHDAGQHRHGRAKGKCDATLAEEYRHARVLSTATAAEAAEQAAPAQPQPARPCSHAHQGTSARTGVGRAIEAGSASTQRVRFRAKRAPPHLRASAPNRPAAAALAPRGPRRIPRLLAPSHTALPRIGPACACLQSGLALALRPA